MGHRFNAEREKGARAPFSRYSRKKATRARTLAAVVLFTVASAAARADNLTLSVYQNAASNLFQTSYPVKDQITSLGFSFSKGLGAASFFTEGGYSHLYENALVSYYAQDAGFDVVRTLGGKSALYLAVKGGGVLYRADFRDLDHVSAGAVAALKSYLAGSSIFNLQYTLDFRKYRWSLFDFLSHKVILSVDKYFESRTTLRAELNWGYKTFFHPYEAVVPPETSEPAVALSEYPGGRRYAGGWGGDGAGGGGEAPLPEAVGPSASLQIASVSGLIAQGIGDHIGIKVSGLRQWTLSGHNPFGSVDEFYLVENPTYDAFSWNGLGFGGELTANAPWNIELKIGYTGFVRDFPGIEAMDLDGASLGVLRHDRRSQWDARLQKDFPRVTLFVSCSRVLNRSNDPLFEWKGYFLQAGFEWNMNWGRD
jgi:hypothetical protein